MGGFPFLRKKAMKWILASASPRRKQLFGELVEEFDIIPAKGEEKSDTSVPLDTLALQLAKAKAEEIALLPIAKDKAVLGADTIVVLGNEVLGKPKDKQDAKRMLVALSGKTHFVYTGVCVSLPTGTSRKELSGVSKTSVLFEKLTKKQIDDYIKTGSPMDKAGAYGIQDGGLVKEIKGSFTGVVGLPMELVKELVKQAEEVK